MERKILIVKNYSISFLPNSPEKVSRSSQPNLSFLLSHWKFSPAIQYPLFSWFFLLILPRRFLKALECSYGASFFMILPIQKKSPWFTISIYSHNLFFLVVLIIGHCKSSIVEWVIEVFNCLFTYFLKLNLFGCYQVYIRALWLCFSIGFGIKFVDRYVYVCVCMYLFILCLFWYYFYCSWNFQMQKRRRRTSRAMVFPSLLSFFLYVLNNLQSISWFMIISNSNCYHYLSLFITTITPMTIVIIFFFFLLLLFLLLLII